MSAWVLALLVGLPTIASNSSCPSSRDIETHLSASFPAQTERAGTAIVVGMADRLMVDLRPQGSFLDLQRTVEVGNDCDERARAAAILIATWWPSGLDWRPRVEAQAAPSQPARRTSLGLSAGVFVSAISDSVAPGARVEVAPAWRKLGLRLSFGGMASHEASLGRGTVRWSRASVEIGPTYGSGRLRLDIGLTAAWLSVRGSGFVENKSSTGTAAGATAGLRALWNWRPVLPWLELRALWWPLSQRTYVVNATMSGSMPHAELQLAAGVAFSLL